MMIRLRAALTARLRDDRGLLSQSLLLTLMIPALIGAALSAVLAVLYVGHAQTVQGDKDAAAHTLAVNLLSSINGSYPAAYLTAGPAQLQAATTYTDPGTGTVAYVKQFKLRDQCVDADTGGACTAATTNRGNPQAWTFAQVYAKAPGPEGSTLYTFRYRPSSAATFMGIDASTGRPRWGYSQTEDASGSTLALYELADDKTTAKDYPAPWDTSQKPAPALPGNVRLFLDSNRGVVLAWDQPSNGGGFATPSKTVAGYIASSTQATAGDSCYAMDSADGNPVHIASAADRAIYGSSTGGWMLLSSAVDLGSPRSWRCNTAASALMSLRAYGNGGLGDKALFSIDALIASATTNNVPLAPAAPTGLRTTAIGDTTAKLAWNAVTCADNAHQGVTAEYRTYLRKAGDAYGAPTDWSAATAAMVSTEPGRNYAWKVDARCVSALKAVDGSALTSVAGPASTPDATFTTVMTAPTAATGLAVTAPGPASSTFNWNSPNCVTGSTEYDQVIFVSGGASTPAATTGSSGTYAHTPGADVEWYVNSWCRSVDGVVSAKVGSAHNTFRSQVPAPTSAPTNLNAYSRNYYGSSIRWSGVSCAYGSPSYLLTGNNLQTVGWTTATDVYATNDDGTTINFRVAARCVYNGHGSDEYGLTTSATGSYYAPTVTTPSGNPAVSVAVGNEGSTYNVSGSSCGYGQLQYLVQGPSSSWGWGNADGSNRVSIYLGNPQGATSSWTVTARCNYDNHTAGTTRSAGNFYAGVNNPSGGWAAISHGELFVTAVGSSWSCGSGASPEYQVVRRRNGYEVSDYGQGWGPNPWNYLTANRGYLVDAYIQVRCRASSGAYSPSTYNSGSPTSGVDGYTGTVNSYDGSGHYWINSLPNPSPEAQPRSGGYRTAAWDGAGCTPGATVSYKWQVRFGTDNPNGAWGTLLSDKYGGPRSTSDGAYGSTVTYQNTNGGWGSVGTGYYVLATAMCSTPWASNVGAQQAYGNPK